MNWPVVAFLNFQRPDLALSMIEQLKGTHLVALDNGGQQPLQGQLWTLTDQIHDYTTLPPYTVWPNWLGPHQEHRPVWRLYRVPKNLYYGGGSNWLMARIAADWPDAEFVWLCNDDITGTSPAMAYALYEYLKANPRVGMISPAIRGTTHRSTQPHGTGAPRQVPFIDVTCPMFRVAMWKELNGYDPDFIGFGTDVDLCARAIKAGWQLVVHDGLVVDHPDPGTTCITQGTMGLHADGRWVDLIYAKHGKPWHVLTTVGP